MFALLGTAFGLSQCAASVGEGADGDDSEESAATSAGLSVIPGFEVFCSFDHRKQEDPIVFPHLRPAGHVHDFFGNQSTDADSTYGRPASSAMVYRSRRRGFTRTTAGVRSRIFEAFTTSRRTSG